MKICIAQTKSLKGNVKSNIENHLRFVKRAIKLNSDLIIFPELSITNYEPTLSQKLSTRIENDIFNPFQELANKNKITIGIGMPTNSEEGIKISTLIFQPNKKRVIYSKQILHLDELAYFVCGNSQVILKIKGKRIAIGICFETLQRVHFLNAYKKGIDIYIASVAKPINGIEKAYNYFPKIAKEFNIPILLSNCIGNCDNFVSIGQSAVWNKTGKLINQLNNKNEGLIVYDLESKLTKIYQPIILKGQLTDLNELFLIYLNGKYELEKNGILQWTKNYPTKSIIESDLRKGVLYTLKNNNEIIGAINISEEQETEYKLIKWKFDNSKVLVIHRLVIDPKYQRKGYAKKLMNFAENFARKNNYSSIRLDAYSQNEKVIDFYKKRNYFIRGDVRFPGREFLFHCMEKEIIPLTKRKKNQTI